MPGECVTHTALLLMHRWCLNQAMPGVCQNRIRKGDELPQQGFSSWNKGQEISVVWDYEH